MSFFTKIADLFRRAVSRDTSAAPAGPWHTVRASSFADPKDVRSFNRCRAGGNSEQTCFGRGDNGIGKWGHVTAQDHTPMCALPREIWQRAGKKGGDKVLVRRGNIVVAGILGDTMPALANIRNGAALDLNPAFAKRLGLTPPFMVPGVEWSWG